MALPFYLIFLVTSVFANLLAELPQELPGKNFNKVDLQSHANNILPNVEDGFTTKLPEHFQWKRVGSRSVDLGWDTKGLANLTADKIKLTAFLRRESTSYVYAAVPIERGKLTLDRLQPNTFYEMLVQALKNDKPVFNSTSYLKTPARGNGAGSIGLSLIFLISGLLLHALW